MKDLLFASSHLKELDNPESNEPEDLAKYEGEASYRDRNFEDYHFKLAVFAHHLDQYNTPHPSRRKLGTAKTRNDKLHAANLRVMRKVRKLREIN